MGSCKRLHLVGLVAAAVWTALVLEPSGVASAQGSTAGQATEVVSAEVAAQSPQPITPEDVPDRAVGVRAELDAILAGEASQQPLDRMAPSLDQLLDEVEAQLAKTHEALAAAPDLRILQQLEVELSETLKRIKPLNAALDNQLAGFRLALGRVDGIERVWDETASAAERDGVSGATANRIAAVRTTIGAAHATLVKQRDRVLAVRDRLVDPSSALAVSLEQVQRATEARLEGILHADRPPLWSAEERAAMRAEWQASGAQGLQQRLLASVGTVVSERRAFALQVVLFLSLVLAMRALRDRARARAQDDYNLREARQVFESPVAMAVLIAIPLTTSFNLAASRPAGFISGAFIAFASLWIGRRFLVPALAPLAWGLVCIFMVDRARDLLDAMPTVERAIFVLEMAAALGFLLWLLRPRRLAEVPVELRNAASLRTLGFAMRAAAAGLATAIVADLAGWGDLASLLGNGVLRGGFAGLFVFVLQKVIQSLATFALILWPLRLLRSVAQHRLLVRRRIEGVLKVLAVVSWAMLVLGQIGLLGSVMAGIHWLLAAGFVIGAISITLGDLLVFAFTVWFSFVLGRLASFVLQEDVFTRVKTGRGVPYAVAGLVRYTLIFLGFLVGLAAAGLELSKLTVIVGGLGVGIGFGLQNVVNNFVSGLILLFERPIQVGDALQLPDVWGNVKHIGIRASVIRTFEGAEVIVPNGLLISDKVTNWTLSDDRRRIEIDVGVAYGTPARRMIELLLEVAKADPHVLADPPPMAFFMNFGDSALEFKLRVWVRFDDGFPLRSGIAVAIQEALEQAGIAVPFPQRDLHLVSAAPEVVSDLGAVIRSKQKPVESERSGDDE